MKTDRELLIEFGKKICQLDNKLHKLLLTFSAKQSKNVGAVITFDSGYEWGF